MRVDVYEYAVLVNFTLKFRTRLNAQERAGAIHIQKRPVVLSESKRDECSLKERE